MIGSFLYALASMVLTIAVIQLVGEDEGFQLSFDFDQTHADSMEQLGSRVDGLRDKYGKQIIRRASQLNNEQKESKDKK